MSKDSINTLINSRIEEIKQELVTLVEKARVTKAQFEELVNIYNQIVTEENYDEEGANKILERAQVCFSDNQEAQLSYNEKSAVVNELQLLLNNKNGGEDGF